MSNSVTIKDVARVAAVSVVTASRVFNNHANVSDDVRQRVLKAAAELGYFGSKSYMHSIRHHLEPGAASKMLKEVGFFFNLTGDLTSGPFWSHIMAGVESEASKQGIHLLLRSINDLLKTPDSLGEAIQSMDIDGILFVGPPDPETLRLFRATGLPVVLIDTDEPNQPFDAVLSDYFAGAKNAVSYLIGQGHRDIAFVTSAGTDTIYTVELRLAGYRTALWNAGIPFDPALYAVSNPDDNIHLSMTPEKGYEACQKLLRQDRPFSAIFCVNDLMAIGCLNALHEAGKRVPEEISVIGFDDIDLAEHLQPPLTTVRVHKEQMGSAAMRALIARTVNPQAEATVTTLKVSLVKRASVAPFVR